jgi:hypothetical protein
MNQVTPRPSLLNAYSTADVATDTSVTPNIHRITGLLPINKGSIVSITADNSRAEVVQLVTVGLASTPTVAVNTEWKLLIGNTGETREGQSKQLSWLKYTAPAVLAATAAADRHNMYVDLARKANNLSNSGAFFALAYPIIQVAYDAQSANYTVGLTVTGGTSGAKGIIIADADAGTTGTLTLALTTPTLSFQDNETLTDTSTGSATTNIPTGATLGVGLAIYDKPGYYKPNRAGQNVVQPVTGFTAAMVNIATAAVIGRGIGTRMLEDFPVYSTESGNLTRGRWEDYTQNMPVAGNTYRKFTIIHKVDVNSGVLPLGAITGDNKTQVLYLNEGDADLAAVTTAINALT